MIDPDQQEIKYAARGKGRRDASLGVWWESSSPEARRELLDETGIIDLITDDLIGLADAFELLVGLSWVEFPEDMRAHLERQVSVQVNQEEKNEAL